MSEYEFPRDITGSVLRLARHFPAVVVTGARQTGKTTLLTKLFPDYQYVSLDLPAEAQLAEEDPQTFLARHPPPLLVDEVQYAPKLFRYLKVEIDRNRNANGRYILTGSQKLSLMREVSDSLAGRCGVLELEALAIHELGEVFAKREATAGIAEVLVRGFMPQLWKDLALRPADFFGGYQATYLERDVRQILNVSSLRDFDRFMRAAAVRSGQLLNKTELAKEVGVSTKTINEWLGVLEATNQITILEPYFANVGKRLVKTPKLYFNDVGLLCFLLGLNRHVVTQTYLIGAIWETFLYGELRKYLSIEAPEASVWFYRDQSREVDFVIERDGHLSLAESKWKEIPAAKDFEQAIAAHELLPLARWPVMVLCRTRQSHPVTDNTLAVNGFKLRDHI
ncbi:MAG: ATP-binding protein [Gammaproteobacteria bacterium]|nr:ATP-binding protein [Gammaproteobacteria bacterium]